MCELEAHVGMMHFEDGGRGEEPRNAGGLWTLGEERKQNLS